MVAYLNEQRTLEIIAKGYIRLFEERYSRVGVCFKWTVDEVLGIMKKTGDDKIWYPPQAVHDSAVRVMNEMRRRNPADQQDMPQRRNRLGRFVGAIFNLA